MTYSVTIRCLETLTLSKSGKLLALTGLYLHDLLLQYYGLNNRFVFYQCYHTSH